MRRKSVHLFVPVGSRAQETHLWKSHADATDSWNNTAANGIPSVPRRALVAESLSPNNLLGLEAVQGLPQLRDGETVGRAEVDNQPHGAPSSGPVSRGGLDGEYMHTYTHTHPHCVHSQPPPIDKSLSAVVSKWSICKCLSQEGDIWPKDLGFQDQPIVGGVHGASFRSSALTLLRRWRKCITVVSGKLNRVKIRGQKAWHFSKTEVGNRLQGLKESKACEG